MAENIPTFRVNISEGMIDVDTDTDRLFAYCIEADRGKVMIPTLVASAAEAQRLYGVDFKPHFYQNPTGLLICRVGYDNPKEAFVEYKAYPLKDGENDTRVPDTNATPETILVISATTPGPCKHKVKIVKAQSIGEGFNLTVDIDDGTGTGNLLISKSYQNLSLEEIKDRINRTFGSFIVAEFSDANYLQKYVPVGVTSDDTRETFQEAQFIPLTPTQIKDEDGGLLTGGSNGVMRDYTGKIACERDSNGNPVDSEGNVITEEEILKKGVLFDVDDPQNGLSKTPEQNEPLTAPNAEQTRRIAYREAFEKTAEHDVLGVATLSDSLGVQVELINHINYMSDPEVYTYRFGITGYLNYDEKNATSATLSKIRSAAQNINNEYMIFIGQGVQFQAENEDPRTLLPYEAVQLFTGIRSSLGYSEAIFGGEQKKVLRGVIDTLPLTTDGTKITKSDVIDLNEHGVCTFKKEYGEVTFVEGVTTVQDNDVMSYENLMSIIVYVTKRLVRIARPYQGQRLTEDLKSTLQTALSAELKRITTSDGTLMALEEFNIPPYDVQVYSAAKTRFDENHQLVRESKIIIQVRIVPIGALRDIDLFVLAI